MKEPRLMSKFKSKWNITTNKDFFLIMLAFSLAGMGISVVKPLEFELLHLEHAPLWLQIIVYPIVVVPAYYLGLLFFGFVLGQFDFCKRFSRNSMQRIGRLFTRANNTTSHK